MKSKLKAKALTAWHTIVTIYMRYMVALMMFAAAAKGGRLCRYALECIEMIISGDKSGGAFRLFELYCYFMVAYGFGKILVKHFKTSKEEDDE